MRRATFRMAAAAGAGAGLAACALFTDLSGLSGAAVDSDGGGADVRTATDATGDERSATDGGAEAAEAGSMQSALYASAVLADNPLGYWRLNEVSGTVAKDETGRHDGVYVRDVMLGQAGAAGSVGIKLPRTEGAHVRVSAAAYRFAGRLPFTIEAWVQPGDIKDYQWIASTEIPPSMNDRSGWSLLAAADGTVHYEAYTPVPDGGMGQVRGMVVSPTPLAPSKFHHVVTTYDGSSVTGYVDGVRGTTQTQTGDVPNVGELAWGCRSDFSYCMDDWTIDELAIYDRPLAIERVQAHFTLGK